MGRGTPEQSAGLLYGPRGWGASLSRRADQDYLDGAARLEKRHSFTSDPHAPYLDQLNFVLSSALYVDVEDFSPTHSFRCHLAIDPGDGDLPRSFSALLTYSNPPDYSYSDWSLLYRGPELDPAIAAAASQLDRWRSSPRRIYRLVPGSGPEQLTADEFERAFRLHPRRVPDQA